MKCSKCSLWLKRELSKDKRHFYPTGACMNMDFYEKGKRQFTSADTNCDRGIRKD